MSPRPPEPDETPRGVASLLKLANDLGWQASAAYAKGRPPESTTEVESVVVRLQCAPAAARAWAVWEDGAFRMAWRWAEWLPGGPVGARALRAWMKQLTDFLAGEAA